MKNSNKEVCLGLEILEDRTALNGAFGGAINAGIPLFTPFNSWIIQSASTGTSQPAVQQAIAGFYNSSGQVPALLNQLQSFQAAQMALIDQLFSDMQSILQALHINTIVMV